MVGFVWSHGEIDENTEAQEAAAEAKGVITSGGENQPRQRLSFSNAKAYGRRLGQLIREVRQQAYRLSCSHAACLSPEQLPFVMVEPWIGAASSCAPSALSREAHRMIMDGVKHAHADGGWENFVQLKVDGDAATDPLHVSRFCDYDTTTCRTTPGCASGKGHFDTRGQLKLGKLLAGWHLRRWWDDEAHWWMMP